MNIECIQSSFQHSQISRISISSNPNENQENGFFEDFFNHDQNLDSNCLNFEMRFYTGDCSKTPQSFLDYLDIQSSYNQDQFILKPNQWATTLNEGRFSKSQSQSEEILIPSTISQQLAPILKNKPIRRSKKHVETPEESNKIDAKTRAKKFQNQTKNLPKNFGKAIIAFSLKRFKDFNHLPQFKEIKYEDFKKELIQKRHSMNTISGLKNVWTEFKYSRCMRLLSNMFLRRYALTYIFNSKISNISPHVKYRFKLLEAIKTPWQFTSIKDS